RDYLEDVLLPFVSAQPFQSSLAEIVLVGAALFVGKMSEFHGLENTVYDHGRAQTRSQSEKKHAPFLVAAERLHGGVVDDLHRLAKGFTEIEFHPARSQIERLVDGTALNYRTGIAD